MLISFFLQAKCFHLLASFVFFFLIHYAHLWWCQFITPPDSVVEFQADLQVIRITSGTSKVGRQTVMVTLSDGSQFMDCHLSPKLFHLVEDSGLTVFDVVMIKTIVTNWQGDCTVVMVFDMLVKVTMDE